MSGRSRTRVLRCHMSLTAAVGVAGKSGAGWGEHRDAAPHAGLVLSDRDCQARRSYAAAVNQVPLVAYELSV